MRNEPRGRCPVDQLRADVEAERFDLDAPARVPGESSGEVWPVSRSREPDGTVVLHHHDTRIRLGDPQHVSAHCFDRFQTSGAKR
ncbi:hypothetical protein ACIBQ6_13615 [Nonomuraea sp. NPDC049655]|uniref:hypothetical protein n=1 Tax=Nonomuraea sp. NPDC049655 TaxID=3364355 RepID=UPI0037A178B4